MPEGLSTFADLLGTWQFTRSIEDRRAGHLVQAEGHAQIASSASGARYAEEALLTLPGHAPMTSTRQYLLQDGGDHVAFHFEDGRYFHRLDYNRPAPRCRHDCPPDIYDVTYDFAAWPIWSATWEVRGPRKDYVMTTAYRRA